MASMRASIELAAKKKGFLAFDEFKGHLTKVSSESSRTRAELQKLNQRAADIGAGMKSAAVGVRNFLLTVGAVAGIGVATKGVLGLAKELKIISGQLGVSTQDMQVWGLAGQKVGVDMEKMRDIFKDTSDKLGDFVATGGGEAKDIVEKLGLNVAKLNAMQPQQVLQEIGNALNNVADISQHEKIFLLEALANDASVLLPLLENNGKMLDEVRAKAELRGQIISDSDLAMLTEANAKITESKSALAGLKHQIGLLGAEFTLLTGTGFAEFIDSISAKLNAFDLTIFIAQIKHGFLVFEETGQQAALYVSTEFQVLLANLGAQFPEQFATISNGWKVFSTVAGAVFASVSGFASDSFNEIKAVWSGDIGVSEAFANIAGRYKQYLGELTDTAESAFERIKGTFVYDALASGVQRALSDIKSLWTEAGSAWDNLVAKLSTKSLESDQAAGWGSIEGIIKLSTAAISAVIERWWSLITGLVQVGLKVLQGDFAGAWNVIETGVDNFVSKLKSSFDGIGGDLLPHDLKTMGSDIMSGLGTVISDVVPALTSAFRDIMNLTQELRETIWYHWDDIKSITSGVWENISNAVKLGWNLVVNVLTVGLRLLRGDFAGAWDAIKVGVNEFVSDARDLLSGLLDPLLSLPEKALQAGADIITGLKDGIKASAAGAVDAMVETGASLFSGFKRKLGIESPSKVMHQAGININEGLTNGINATRSSVINAGQDVANDLGSALSKVPVNSSVLDEIGASASGAAGKIAVLRGEYDRSVAASKARIEASRAGLDALKQQQVAEVAVVEVVNKSTVAANQVAVATKAAGTAKVGAAAKTKQLTEAEQAAKKSADELARAQQGIADQFVAAEQKQVILNAALAGGDAAGRQLELRYSSMHNGVMLLSASRAAELQQIEAANTAIEEEIKRREEASKAIEAANKAVKDSAQSLDIARKAIGMNDEQLTALTLSYKDGYTKELAAAQAANEAKAKSLDELRSAQIAATDSVKDAEKALKLAESSIGKTDQQVRTLELSLTEGYTPALAAAQSAAEAKANATDELRSAQQAVQKALEDTAKSLNVAEKALHLTDLGLRELELSLTKGYTPAQAEAQAADEARIKVLGELRTAQEGARKALEDSEKSLKVARDSYGKTEQEIRSLELSLTKGYTPAMASAQAANEKLAASQSQFNDEMRDLTQNQRLLEVELSQGADAAKRAELGMSGYNKEQINTKLATEDNISKLEEMKSAGAGIGQTLTDGLLSGDWKSAGQSLLGIFKSSVLEPLLNNITGGIGNALSGVMSSVSSGIGSIFGGGASAGGGGFLGSIFGGAGGIGSLLGGGLLTAAIPLIAGLFSSDPQEVKGKFGSFGSVVQGKNSVANKPDRTFYQTGRSKSPMHRTSDFGQFGLLSDGSQSVGRDSDEQIAAIQAALTGMQQLDNVIASFLPSAQIERVKANLDGLTSNALNTEEMTRERLTVIFSSMDGQLKNAFQGGMNVMAGTTEEIAARFAHIAQVNQSVLPTFDQLGFNLGNTETAALAAAVGLADAAGGIEALLAGTQSYVDKFYTDTEKQNMAMSAAAAQVEQFNTVLGRTGASAVDSREEFRAYVESLDLTTKAGQDAYAEAMAVVDSMYAVSESGQTLDEIMSSLPKAMLDNAKAMLNQADIVEKAGGGTEKALGGVGDSLASLTKTAARSASSIASAATKISSIKIASKSDSGLIELPKFATGGITSGTSIAGEAGPEAVIPLPDGRTVPVSLSIPNASIDAFKRVEVYHTGSIEYAEDQREMRFAATQYQYQESGTIGGHWYNQENALREKSRWATDSNVFDSYESGMASLESTFSELTAVATTVKGIDWNGEQFRNWSQSMKDSYTAANDAVNAAQAEYDANQVLIEQRQKIESDYQSQLQAAEDLRFEMQFGTAALRERQMLESGLSMARINNLFAIEKEVAALDAEKTARDEAIASIDASKLAHEDALQSEKDRRFELLHGDDALERELLLRAGWTRSMISGWSAQKAANDELERQVGVYDSLKSMAVDLRTAANDLQFDSNLGLSSPAEMLAAARAEVEQLASSAVTDPEAAAALSGAVQNALQLSREYNASSAAYVADFENMTGLLGSVASQIESLDDPVRTPISEQINVNQNVIDARPVFNQQQQNTEKDRRIDALEKQNNDLQKQMIELLKELRDDQREIAVDAFDQRAESNNKQSDATKEIKQLREQQRTDARFQDVA